MFTNKDYQNYFDELLVVELEMKKEGEKLKKVVKDPKAQVLLTTLINDEIRHAEIVRAMKKLI